MHEDNENTKKAYRRPEVTSQKLSLGVYGSYGVDPGRSQPERNRGGDHRDWSAI